MLANENAGVEAAAPKAAAEDAGVPKGVAPVVPPNREGCDAPKAGAAAPKGDAAALWAKPPKLVAPNAGVLAGAPNAELLLWPKPEVDAAPKAPPAPKPAASTE